MEKHILYRLHLLNSLVYHSLINRVAITRMVYVSHEGQYLLLLKEILKMTVDMVMIHLNLNWKGLVQRSQEKLSDMEKTSNQEKPSSLPRKKKKSNVELNGTQQLNLKRY
jgi:hypothetical protein